MHIIKLNGEFKSLSKRKQTKLTQISDNDSGEVTCLVILNSNDMLNPIQTICGLRGHTIFKLFIPFEFDGTEQEKEIIKILHPIFKKAQLNISYY